jgi:hypothetical protein
MLQGGYWQIGFATNILSFGSSSRRRQANKKSCMNKEHKESLDSIVFQ